MPLRVVSFAIYLTNVEVPWRGEDYDALKFVKAIKGKPINKYAYVPVGGTRRLLQQQNADDAISWFGEMASGLNHFAQGNIALVPVPNSSCTVANRNVPRTALLAQALSARLKNAQVLDVLRWKKPMLPSSQGGTRDPRALYNNLVITGPLPKRKLVLVDDVRTTGAHLIASAARLAEKGGQVNLAVCAARTVWDQDGGAFSVLEEELEMLNPQRK